jgi:tetratricopeptide (TPR) repeat protein
MPERPFRAHTAALLALALAACRQRAEAREKRALATTSGALAPLAGDGPIEREIRREQDTLRARPREIRGYLALARLFVRKARQSEDPGFYLAAHDAARRALDLDARNVEALQLRAFLLLQDHRFRKARDITRALAARPPVAPETWAILSDALMELGGIRDARVLFHAGMIRHALGDRAAAVDALRAALDANPHWDRAEADEARRVLAQLGAPYVPPTATDAVAPPR